MDLTGRDFRPYLRWLYSLTLFLPLIGCATIAQLPEVDLSAPGWQVWTGQALWKADADRAPIAGDILLARHFNGDLLISFAKPPVSIFTAQTSANLWHIDFMYQQRVHSGRGKPPSRFVWFQVPALLKDSSEPKGWQILAAGGGVWELQNPATGESIRLVLDQ